MSCKYCKNLNTCNIPEEIPINSNVDLSRTIAIIAHGATKPELILTGPFGAHGIEIDYCPRCGEKLC